MLREKHGPEKSSYLDKQNTVLVSILISVLIKILPEEFANLSAQYVPIITRWGEWMCEWIKPKYSKRGKYLSCSKRVTCDNYS